MTPGEPLPDCGIDGCTREATERVQIRLPDYEHRPFFTLVCFEHAAMIRERIDDE